MAFDTDAREFLRAVSGLAVSTLIVDLAVEGLPPEAYWSAWRLAEELITDRSVDLVTLEDAAPSLRSSAERHGIAL